MMQTLIDLPKRAQVAFLLQIVERLDKLTKQFASQMRFCSRAHVVEPHVLFDGKTLEWQFSFEEDSYVYDEDAKNFYETSNALPSRNFLCDCIRAEFIDFVGRLKSGGATKTQRAAECSAGGCHR